MFEKDVVIPDRDNKTSRLQLELLKNTVFGNNKKKVIKNLEVWNGIHCMFNCKYCFRAIPFVTQKPYDINLMKQDFRILSQIADIKDVTVGGGDPFYFHKMDELLPFLFRDIKVQTVTIRTNGLTIPSDTELVLLNKFRDTALVSLQIMASSGELFERILEFQKKLDYADVNYLCVDQTASGLWTDCGRPSKRHHYQSARRSYLECEIKRHPTLFDGILYGCPRGVNYREITGNELPHYDMLNLRMSRNMNIARALFEIVTESEEYREYCRCCLGRSARNPLRCSSDEKWTS